MFCLRLMAEYVSKNTATHKNGHQGKKHECSQEEVKVRSSDMVRNWHNKVVLNLGFC